MKKIDIIIPSYKSQAFLHKALSSIALQTVADRRYKLILFIVLFEKRLLIIYLKEVLEVSK